MVGRLESEWTGSHWFAFVDPESNPVDDLAKYLKHETDHDRRATMYEVSELQQCLETNQQWPTRIKVRILTPVVVSVN